MHSHASKHTRCSGVELEEMEEHLLLRFADLGNRQAAADRPRKQVGYLDVAGYRFLISRLWILMDICNFMPFFCNSVANKCGCQSYFLYISYIITSGFAFYDPRVGQGNFET